MYELHTLTHSANMNDEGAINKNVLNAMRLFDRLAMVFGVDVRYFA